MIRLAIVGGTAIYHGLSFGALINGLADGQEFPENWPPYPQCVEDARITVVWDEDRAAAEKLAQVYGIEHIATSLEEVLPHCDGVIVTDDGTQQHYRHAPFFLERGIPTFIDKPLAPDVKTAQMLVDLAAKHGTPLMSGSALRYAGESEEIRANPAELGCIELAVATGPNELFYYGIHALELAHSILGGGFATVQNIGDDNQDVVKISYADGRILLLLISRTAGLAFEITLYGPQGRQHIAVKDSAAYYSNLLHQVVKMVRDNAAPSLIQEEVEIIRVLEAGKESLRNGGKPVDV